MNRDEILSFFSAREKVWRARDPISLAHSHAPDGVVVSPMFGELRGRQAIADSFVRLFKTFPDWEFTSQEVLVDGEQAVQLFTTTATHEGEFMGLPGTRRQAKIEGVLVCTMRDGLIQHERRIYDFTALLIQIGVLRSKPAF